MSKVTVFAGICGFTAIIKAKKSGKKKIKVDIFCPCDMIKKLNDDLDEIDVPREVFGEMCNSVVYELSSKHVKHVACPVPSAILKAIEVETDLALPKNVTMKIEK
jgi:hypothetical protein